jgi:hypothetical protein
MLYLGGSGEWSKEVGFKGSIPKVEDLRLELKRIGKAIVKHFLAVRQSVLSVAHDAEVCESKPHFLGLCPSSWGISKTNAL